MLPEEITVQLFIFNELEQWYEFRFLLFHQILQKKFKNVFLLNFIVMMILFHSNLHNINNLNDYNMTFSTNVIIIIMVARISLTLSRHSSLSFIALGRSSGQHPVSSHSCWMYVRAGRPAFARPCVGIHKSTSLMSSTPQNNHSVTNWTGNQIVL